MTFRWSRASSTLWCWMWPPRVATCLVRSWWFGLSLGSAALNWSLIRFWAKKTLSDHALIPHKAESWSNLRKVFYFLEKVSVMKEFQLIKKKLLRMEVTPWNPPSEHPFLTLFEHISSIYTTNRVACSFSWQILYSMTKITYCIGRFWLCMQCVRSKFLGQTCHFRRFSPTISRFCSVLSMMSFMHDCNGTALTAYHRKLISRNTIETEYVISNECKWVCRWKMACM